MDIRGGVDGLKTLLGVPSTGPTQTGPAKTETASSTSGLAGDRATLSSAGAEISEATTSGSDARMERVAAVQAAIASGTYNVPASQVAGKIVDAMLSSMQSSSD